MALRIPTLGAGLPQPGFELSLTMYLTPASLAARRTLAFERPDISGVITFAALKFLNACPLANWLFLSSSAKAAA